MMRPSLVRLAAALALLASSAGSAAGPLVSLDEHDMVRWIRASNDSRGAPFVLIDKRAATLRVYDASGQPAGSTPVLLGRARGDRFPPGAKDKPMAQMSLSDRVTPAGRFLAEPGRNHAGEDVIWIDHDAGISMHRVRAVSVAEQRMERLLSNTPQDNRISYGCINVPAAFYETVLKPAAARRAMVYVLPETRPAAQWFGFGSM